MSRNNSDGVVRTLSKLVSINSVFPNEKNVAVHIERILKSNGFSTLRDYVSKDRFNLLAERGTGEDSILFYGHIDTVPLYGSWKGGSAFKLRSEGDKLFGLGACDMKGGDAAVLESVKTVRNRRVKLMFCVDEENISEGAWSVVKRHRRWFNDVVLMVAAEAGVSDKNCGGADIITLGRRGRCVIALEIKGRSAHGSEPERGISAIDEAAKIALNLKKLNLVTHKKLGRESVFVRETRSASTSLSIPDTAYMELDLHIVPPSTSAEARRRVEKFVAQLSRNGTLNKATKVTVYLKKRKTPYLEPYITDTADRRVGKVLSIIKRKKGRITLSYGLSVADENVLATLKIPAVTIGPEGGNEHTANEWVSRRSLVEVMELFNEIQQKV